MNEMHSDESTSQEETPDEGFDPRRINGIGAVERSTEDQLVAGVCAGTAKYLRIDPVVLRVIVAVLTVVGFAGLILYVAAWIFLPTDDGEKSLASQWFRIDDNHEEQVRIVALIIAGIVAITSGSGMIGGHWDRPFPWFGLAVLAIIYVWWIRPAQSRRAARQSEGDGAPHEQPGIGHPVEGHIFTRPVRQPTPKTSWSPALTFVTLSVILIALGGLAIYAQSAAPLAWTTYVVTALGIIAVGVMASAWWGNGGPLIVIGAVVAIALSMSAFLPNSKIGNVVAGPATAADISDSYNLGIGDFALDLTKAGNGSMLEGRAISVKVGIGKARIIVPRDVNVQVWSTVRAGSISIFGRNTNGTMVSLSYPADKPEEEKLEINIIESIGSIEVIRQ